MELTCRFLFRTMFTRNITWSWWYINGSYDCERNHCVEFPEILLVLHHKYSSFSADFNWLWRDFGIW